jgi:hypothetical protein|tara:strand:+ start:804 stop:962 length:159 start_codon:yes stop_codon:yes gene_type:complete
VLDQNFRFQLARQNDDVSWSWEGDFSATWKSVETEIKAGLTQQFLLQLKQFD